MRALRSTFIGLVLLLAPIQAWAALALDGHAKGSANTAVTTATATLTTTSTNDVIIACVTVNAANSTAVQVSSITDGASLTWTRRSQTGGVDSNSHYDDLECWWAASSGTLTSDAIVAHASASTDTIGILVFGISGANTSTPFDANASLPKSVQNLTASSSNPGVTGFSTTSTNTFAYGIFVTNANAGGSMPTTAPTGWTTLDSQAFSGTASFNDAQNGYGIYSAAQTSLSPTFGSGTFYTANWLMTADAVVQGSGGGATVSRRTLTGVGN
jgi:hypothetical protein